MNRLAAVRVLFVFAGLYDGILGVAFLIAGPALFQWLEIRAPNHWGYVHFICELLIIFGLMFFSVAVAPQRHRHLIVYGILLKLSYSGTVFYHWAAGGLPNPWKPFAFIDLAMAAAFAWAYVAIGRAMRDVRPVDARPPV